MSEKKPFTEASFYAYLNENKLMGSRCPACDESFLPPRALCPRCFGDELDWVAFSGKAKLAAYTTIAIAPSAMIEVGYGRDNPYVAGIVELDEGVKVSAQILGSEETVKIGTPLMVTFLERGEGDAKKSFLAFKAE